MALCTGTLWGAYIWGKKKKKKRKKKEKVTMKSAGAASSETLMTFTGVKPNVELARDKSLSEPQSNHYALNFTLFHMALIQG